MAYTPARFNGQIDTPAGIVMYDLEVYPNYFLTAFKRLSDGKVLTAEAFTPNKPTERDRRAARLSVRNREAIRNLMTDYTTVGFNSRNYDLPVILAAIDGWHTAGLYNLSCSIIKQNAQGWQTQKEHGLYNPRIENRTIDIDEPAPSVMVSLKLYMARLDAPTLQDLPYPFDTWLTREQANNVKAYCGNDLDGTEMLFHDIKPRLGLRVKMGDEYKQNLMSKSDAQIAEAVVKTELAKVGVKTRKSPIPSSVTYEPPAYLNFKTDAMQEVFDLCKTHTFEVNKATGKLKLPKFPKIELAGVKYKMGIGGLHSQEKAQVVEPADDELLIDNDVSSYYPAIIIRSGLYPEALGAKFLDIYKSIVMRRLRAKKLSRKLKAELKAYIVENVKVDGVDFKKLNMERDIEIAVTEDGSLKITINGAFGKLGSPYSFLYAPKLLLAVTLTGQLALLMLIERVVEAGFKVVSANTDGFVTIVPKARYDLYDTICKRWEKATGFIGDFGLDETRYSGLYSRDVNNYLAVTTDGVAKGKGVFKKMGSSANPRASIIPKAVTAFIKDGVPVEETIDGCFDIRQFVSVQRVNGGAVWHPETHTQRRDGTQGTGGVPYDASVPDTDTGPYLGRVARWVWTTDGSTIHYKTNGNKVPKTGPFSDKPPFNVGGSTPVMNLVDFPETLDLQRYHLEAQDLLKRMGIEYNLKGCTLDL